MSPPVPKTAMVFAAGLGTRMRPITETLPKPLVKVGGRALIDHCLDRLAENGVERAIVNVHWLADQIEAHLAARRAPKIVISDERAKLLDQGGGIKRALPMIGDEPFLICNTDAFWIEGPRSNHRPPRRGVRSRARWTSCSWSRRAPARSASTGRAISPWRPTGGLSRASRATSRPSSIPASASSSRELFASEPADVFRLAPFFHAAAAQGPALRRAPRRPLGACRAAGERSPRRRRAIDRSIL